MTAMSVVSVPERIYRKVRRHLLPWWHRTEEAAFLYVGRAEQGLEGALDKRKPERTYRRKADGDFEAHLIAVSCGKPPPGHARWSLRLLADRMVELEYVDAVSYETVRRVLKKTN